MGNGGIGAKAGLIAGVIYGIISGIGSYALLIVYKTQVMKSLSTLITSADKSIGLTAASLYSTELKTAIIGGIFGGLIIGLILGFIFGHIYKKLPGKSNILKGLSFGIILWLIFNVGIGLLNLKTFGITYYISSVGIGIIGVIVYGYLLGYFFGKWNKDTAEPVDENIQ